MKNPDSDNLIAKNLTESRLKTPADLDSFKKKIAKRYKIPVLSNAKLLKLYHDFEKNKSRKNAENLENLLRKRKIRSLSGIAVVSVLTKPYPCPGKCLYCPSQKGMPKSYLSNEPAVMRAILNKFDPYKQTQSRLKALNITGHPTDKIELIVIGGTWSYLPEKYQEQFIRRCFEAANGKSSANLENAQKINEKAKRRIVGITIETRPDFIDEKEILRLRELGVTRVELGVQNIYDDILKLNKRGHHAKAIVKATQLLKDAGFKICYHIMPNLPGSDLKRDKKMFEEIFKNPDFQPDLLKIYPCAILKEAEIYKLWKAEKYKPYTDKQLIDLLKNAKKKIPYYCRIQRLVRDIPAGSIVEGPAKISNLRQVIAKEAKKENWHCHCIRCREVRENYNPKEKLYLFRQDYDASNGKEVFLSYENKNRERIYSLLRLRIPSGDQFFPVLKNTAIIREIHTYGQMHPLRKGAISPQHKGLGKKLIKEAEKISKQDFGLKKIAVISGAGVRNYYRKLGYKLKDTYLIKDI